MEQVTTDADTFYSYTQKWRSFSFKHPTTCNIFNFFLDPLLFSSRGAPFSSSWGTFRCRPRRCDAGVVPGCGGLFRSLSQEEEEEQQQTAAEEEEEEVGRLVYPPPSLSSAPW